MGSGDRDPGGRQTAFVIGNEKLQWASACVRRRHGRNSGRQTAATLERAVFSYRLETPRHTHHAPPLATARSTTPAATVRGGSSPRTNTSASPPSPAARRQIFNSSLTRLPVGGAVPHCLSFRAARAQAVLRSPPPSYVDILLHPRLVCENLASCIGVCEATNLSSWSNAVSLLVYQCSHLNGSVSSAVDQPDWLF
jgi:hypothetical protein